MRYTSSFIALLVSTAVAAPIVERQAPAAGAGLSTGNSIQDMLKGVIGFPTAFLSGDGKGLANAVTGMVGGAASFPLGFFSDLGKAVGVGRTAEQSTPAPTTPADVLTTSAFSPKMVQGVAQDVAQVLGGAPSLIIPGFFSHLMKDTLGLAPKAAWDYV
ncbi:hypothetical protein EG328_009845 [Venturia inaequalis]|uniref:Uncharacterized protein n=1 Tax=Venturia inaequalis TaxID=5025 RepID=A0A8H3V8W4_VENIN|nr:hypothetical protein EG328_009845 [Venturia inaequalis]